MAGPPEVALPIALPAEPGPSDAPTPSPDQPSPGASARGRKPKPDGASQPDQRKSVRSKSPPQVGPIAAIYPTPGPGDHNPEKPLHRSAAYSFGRPNQKYAAASPSADWKTVQRSKSAEPGPGTFEPKSPHLHKAPAYGFGSTERKMGVITETRTPGPGFYNPKKPLHRGPGWAMGSGKDNAPPSPSRPPLSQTPGPGTQFASATLEFGAKDGAQGRAASARASSGGAGAEEGGKRPGAQITNSAGFADNLAGAVDVDWDALSAKLPTGQDAASKERRAALWKRADPNGNGYLSSAEVCN